MASYVVWEPPSGGDVADSVYVRDGFHWLAFLVPPLWLALHRLWIEALVALALFLSIGTVAALVGQSGAGSLVSLLLSLWIGLEAPALHSAALGRRGWRGWGVVEAGSPGEAAIRHLTEHGEAGTPGPFEAAAPAPAPARAARPSAGPALGLFSYPGRN